jgi:RimJ/RimL family protein N-acetyltransferase
MKVSIEPLREEHAYTSVKWRNIPDLWIHTKFTATREITLGDELDWIRKVTADESSRRFAILADGVYVGNIYLTDIHKAVGEYHIFIGEKSYWGKGIAREASNLLISYAQDQLHLKAIELGVKEDNVAAFRLYKSLGFKLIGEDKGFTRMRLKLSHSTPNPNIV